MSRSTSAILTAGAALLLLIGCSGTGSGSDIIRQAGSDGVLEIIHTAKEPLPAPWILHQDLVIGTEYGDENYMLRSPDSFLVTSDGHVVIFDTKPVELRIYDSAGTFLRAFGQPGEGPGDLPAWIRLSEVGEGIFAGWSNAGGFRIQTWRLSGELLSVDTLPVDYPFSRGFIRSWDGRSLTLRMYEIDRSHPDRYVTDYFIAMSDLAGSSVDTLVHFTAIHPKRSRDAVTVEAMSPGDLSDANIPTSDGRWCYSNSNEDWIRVFSLADGSETMRFRWEHDPGPIPEWRIQEVREFGGEQFGEQWVEGLKEYEHAPWRFTIEEGPEGEIWVQRSYEPDESGQWAVDVFDHGGVYRGRIMSPVSLHTMQTVGRSIYVIGTVGEAPALVRYHLEER